jgi:predicted porin
VQVAPAAPPASAPAITLKPYGFVLLTYHQNDGKFALTDYPGQVLNEDEKSAMFAARQSRIGFNASYADGTLGDVKLAGRVEFDFFGPGATSWDSAPLRLRYAYATAAWDLARYGKVTVLAGQTDGLVNPLHPELIAQIATPTLMHAGNYFRRSPQLRVTYDNAVGPVALRAEAAALSPTDATGVALSAGNQSGMPDLEGRLQAAVKPTKDVSATVGVSYHFNVRHYAAVAGVDDTDNTKDVHAVEESDVDATAVGVDFDVSVPYAGLRGEWFKGKGTDDMYFGIGPGVAVLRADTDPLTADDVTAVETTGWWIQAIGKPLPRLWIVAGYGRTEVDEDTLAAHGAGSTERLENEMLHLGAVFTATKAWKLGVEYTQTTSTTRNKTVYTSDLTPVVFEGTGSSVTLSSRFHF